MVEDLRMFDKVIFNLLIEFCTGCKVVANEDYKPLQWIRFSEFNESCNIARCADQKVVKYRVCGSKYPTDQVDNEFEMLWYLWGTSVNLIVPLAICFGDTCVEYLVFDEYHHKDLSEHLFFSKKLLNDNEATYLFKQVIDGVSLLHKNGIVHRDLCTNNILVKDLDMKQIVVGDLGVACLETEKCEDIVGRTNCRPLNPEPYSLKYDIYGLGRIGNAIFNKRKLITDKKELLEKLQEQTSFDDDTWNRLVNLPSKKICTILEKCISEDPNERPTIQELQASFPNVQ